MVTRTRGSERATAEAERVLDLLNSLGSTTFRQLLWQRASELDLTYAQSQVLFYVAEHPGAHMGDVAKAFGDRKSTRLNSSHTVISYAVFCLKKKNRTEPRKGPC